MLEIYTPETGTPAQYISYPFPCGLAAENEATGEWLSLDEYVTQGKNASILYARVRGESMADLGIETGDLLVVDRLKRAENGAVVLARLGKTYTIKKFSEIEADTRQRNLYLVPANAKFQKKKLAENDDFEIVGVVIYSVKKFGV